MSELLPLYDMMSEYDLPIWIYPRRGFSIPDYTTENTSNIQEGKLIST